MGHSLLIVDSFYNICRVARQQMRQNCVFSRKVTAVLSYSAHGFLIVVTKIKKRMNMWNTAFMLRDDPERVERIKRF